MSQWLIAAASVQPVREVAELIAAGDFQERLAHKISDSPCLIETNGNFDAMMQIIIARSLLASFADVVWTALKCGALWRVQLDQPLRTDMLVHARVLRMLVLVWPKPKARRR